MTCLEEILFCESLNYWGFYQSPTDIWGRKYTTPAPLAIHNTKGDENRTKHESERNLWSSQSRRMDLPIDADLIMGLLNVPPPLDLITILLKAYLPQFLFPSMSCLSCNIAGHYKRQKTNKNSLKIQSKHQDQTQIWQRYLKQIWKRI